MDEIEIKLLDKSTVDEQIDVYRDAFSSTEEISVLREMWVVKHYKNPAGDSLIFGAYDGDKLIGINGFMPFDYIYGDKVYKAVQSCISGVRKEYRGKGLWSKLLVYATDYLKNSAKFDFIFGFPNIRNSYHGFIKLGWYDLCDMKNYLVINNASPLIKKRFPGFPSFLAKPAGLQSVFVKLNGRTKKTDGIFECDIESYLKSISGGVDSEKIRLDPNGDFFRWKTEYSGLMFAILKREGKEKAAAIYSVSEYEGTEIIRLYTVKPCSGGGPLEEKDYAALVRYLMKNNKNAAFIRTWIKQGDTEREKLLKKLKFIKSKHRNPFILYPLKSESGEYTDSGLWDLSFLDLD